MNQLQGVRQVRQLEILEHARREQFRERQLAPSQAVAEIEADAQLQALITRFDGELDRASIAPLDS